MNEEESDVDVGINRDDPQIYSPKVLEDASETGQCNNF